LILLVDVLADNSIGLRKNPLIRFMVIIKTLERLDELANSKNQIRHIQAETINGLYKTELIHRRAPWKTRESVELATLEWVHWFNHIRLLEPIGYLPPAEAEANYWRQLASEATPVAST